MLFNHHQTKLSLSARTTARSRGQHGYVMVMFALLLVPLLLMAGLAVDVGHWYSRASDMRRAADAAALAGVVWLPDEAAARNGFVPSSTVSVTVTASTQSDRRLKVTIRDTKVGSFFYTSLGGNDIDLTRTSFAEYVLAVPMGSPRNFFGTGTLLEKYTATGIPAEYLYQSVNPYCTDKVNGDRHQSGFNGVCTGTANSEYRTTGYSMYIEAPEGRTAPIDVKLYDARYNNSDISWQVPGADNCQQEWVYAEPPVWNTGSGTGDLTINAPVRYQTRNTTSGSWSATTTITSGSHTRTANLLRYQHPNVINWNPSATTWRYTNTSTSIQITGPAQYQTRTSTGAAWSTTQTLHAGKTLSRNQNLLQYRTGTYQKESVCTPTYTTVTDTRIDEKRLSGDDDYTYTLYGADNTPLNDDDNPQICQQTFTSATAFDGTEYLGSRRWNTLCSISTTALAGRYILRVTNGGVSRGATNDGSNQWGLVAKYATTGDGLCDGRTDTMCPRVYGKDAISVKAAATTQVASFFLAEIESEHAGKKLKLELFDPGEGGNNIQIMKPSGTDGNTWTATPFSWKANTSPETTGNNVTSLDVTGNKFNGKLVEITIDLAGYAPPTNNDWWQIQYTFTSNVTVTDRTTWSARIIGDPVHLVEEY